MTKDKIDLCVDCSYWINEKYNTKAQCSLCKKYMCSDCYSKSELWDFMFICTTCYIKKMADCFK